jgi:hypothetical protein
MEITATPEQEVAVDQDVEITDAPDNANTENQEQAPAKVPLYRRPQESTPPPSIPYSRFREVNDERKTLAKENEEFKARIADLTAERTKLDAIKGPEDIKIEDYTDPQEYLKDLMTATKLQTKKELLEEQNQKDQQRALNTHINTIGQAYQKNINEAVARDPEIAEAKAWFDANAGHLVQRRNLALELMLDENAGS